MTSTPTRRPLPALVFLLALTLLTALVWWRVLHRSDSQAAGPRPCPTPSTSPAMPRPAEITVSVLNGTQRTHLARATAATLKKDGFAVSGYGNDTTPTTGVGQIRYTAAAAAEARLVSYYLPGAKLVPVTTATPHTDVVISLGASYKRLSTAVAVSAAMAADHESFAPSPAATGSATPTC